MALCEDQNLDSKESHAQVYTEARVFISYATHETLMSRQARYTTSHAVPQLSGGFSGTDGRRQSSMSNRPSTSTHVRTGSRLYRRCRLLCGTRRRTTSIKTRSCIALALLGDPRGINKFLLPIALSLIVATFDYRTISITLH